MRDYQRNTAEAILQPETWAPHWKSLVQITDQGVFLSRTGHSDPDLAWSPSCAKSSFDAIDKPVLPFPFSEQDLAAFMLDGIGARVVAEFGVLGQAPFPDALKRFSQTEQSAVHALSRAFACVQAARIRLGGFDDALERKVTTQRDALQAARRECASLKSQLTELTRQRAQANSTGHAVLWSEKAKITTKLDAAQDRLISAEEAHQQATEAYQGAWQTWRDEMVEALFEAKEIASDSPIVNNSVVQGDATTATRSKLIEAFGPCSKMDIRWFKRLRDRPALMKALHTKGIGGRQHREPTFYVWPIVQSLMSIKPKRLNKATQPERVWAAYERHFPDSARFNSAAKPGDDSV